MSSMENPYDDLEFFKQYAQMSRSRNGLEDAGEWPALRELLPNLENKTILDLGCGYGHHILFALENNAKSVIGVDISQKMIDKAQQVIHQQVPSKENQVKLIKESIDRVDFVKDIQVHVDLVFSSLAFHYLPDFDHICKLVKLCLDPETPNTTGGGDFIFSVEHPVFTASGTGSWLESQDGQNLCWPVDHYFQERPIKPTFIGKQVQKYHRTLQTYLNTLIQNDFTILKVVEPLPDQETIQRLSLQDEMRRPMMLLVKARLNTKH